jgi:hypothetical protein
MTYNVQGNPSLKTIAMSVRTPDLLRFQTLEAPLVATVDEHLQRVGAEEFYRFQRSVIHGGTCNVTDESVGVRRIWTKRSYSHFLRELLHA